MWGKVFSRLRWACVTLVRQGLRWDPVTRRRLRGGRGVLLGTRTGGWRVPGRFLTPGMTVISAGVGEEISFDRHLLNRVPEARVTALDPTPRAVEVGEAAAAELPGFSFVALGLWDKDGDQVFHAPRNPDHVSHSLVALQGESPGFSARCVCWKTLLQELSLETVDLLKMDIEGAEYRVIADIVSSGPLPRVLCLEFDELQTPMDSGWSARIRETVASLGQSGYVLAGIVHKGNYSFVRDERL